MIYLQFSYVVFSNRIAVFKFSKIFLLKNISNYESSQIIPNGPQSKTLQGTIPN